MHKKLHRLIRFTLLIPATAAALTSLLTTSNTRADEKLRPEEVVARHLEAIGLAEARSPERSRVASGATWMEAKAGGRGINEGQGLIASTGDKVLLNAAFQSADYPYERIGFDGERVSARPIRPNVRSPLSNFFLSHETVFKEGLIGGVLSTAWPLLHLEERKAKLTYSGTAEVAGRPAHKLRYAPRKGSDLKVTLYFDAETFRHLRTDYEHTVPAPIGATPDQSVSQRETRYRLVEDFSDFKTEGGLTLPRSYTVGYTVFSTGTPTDITWKFTLTRVNLDQPIDPKVFVTDGAEK